MPSGIETTELGHRWKAPQDMGVDTFEVASMAARGSLQHKDRIRVQLEHELTSEHGFLIPLDPHSNSYMSHLTRTAQEFIPFCLGGDQRHRQRYEETRPVLFSNLNELQQEHIVDSVYQSIKKFPFKTIVFGAPQDFYENVAHQLAVAVCNKDLFPQGHKLGAVDGLISYAAAKQWYHAVDYYYPDTGAEQFDQKKYREIDIDIKADSPFREIPRLAFREAYQRQFSLCLAGDVVDHLHDEYAKLPISYELKYEIYNAIYELGWDALDTENFKQLKTAAKRYKSSQIAQSLDPNVVAKILEEVYQNADNTLIQSLIQENKTKKTDQTSDLTKEKIASNKQTLLDGFLYSLLITPNGTVEERRLINAIIKRAEKLDGLLHIENSSVHKKLLEAKNSCKIFSLEQCQDMVNDLCRQHGINELPKRTQTNSKALSPNLFEKPKEVIPKYGSISVYAGEGLDLNQTQVYKWGQSFTGTENEGFLKNLVEKLQQNNLGRYRTLGPNFYEHKAGGLRVYYTFHNEELVLLHAGDKRTQSRRSSSDIDTARIKAANVANGNCTLIKVNTEDFID